MRRYLFNTVSQIVTMYMLFAVMFFGGQQLAGTAITRSIEGIVVGYFLFTLIMSAYSSIAGNITKEAQWGTLEQLYMSPLGFNKIVGVKTVVNVSVSLLIAVILLVLMMVTAGVSLNFDLITIVPIIILALAPAVGLGYVFGGLALLYKRIENVFRLIQFAFIGLVAAPVDQLPVLKLAPFSLGSYLLRETMSENKSLMELPATDLVLLFVLGVGYLLAGYAIFRVIQTKARERGVLGEY